MKTLFASIFALALLGAGATHADIIGAHVGPVGIGIGVHHYHHCGWRHHHRHCW